jgi:multiple sugar transport system ATP-binding protein
MRTEIRELHQRLSTTTVYVTHDQIEAMTMADKIVVMQGGNIEQVGSPLEVYDRPANTFVAGFIGSPAMNLLDAVIRHEGGRVFAEVEGTLLPLDADLENGRIVTVGLRPEHLQPAGDGIAGQIAVVEPTGAETYLIVRVGIREVTAVLRDRRDVRPGQEIRLQAEPGMMHVFDRATGRRL